MSKILEAIDKFATQTYSDEWKLEAIRNYTETGDEALLTGLQLIPRSPAAYELAAALPDPDAWTGEAARALRLAHLTGVHVVLEIWLKRYGFEPGRPRLIEAGKTQVEARIDPEFKLGFRDVKTGKAMTKLPAGTPAEVQAEFKTLTGTLKEAVKAQLLRIETLLVRQFRWPVPRWRAWYLAHPLLRPFTQRLVWGWRDAAGELRHTFRALDDASLTDVEDHPVTLPDEGSVSLVHPLDLSEGTRSAWLQHLADYEIAPPIGAGMDSNIQLGDLCFVKTGAVKVGSYSYDEPAKEDDPRLIPFGDVPAVPFSEVMGDLIKIAGAKPEPETT